MSARTFTPELLKLRQTWLYMIRLDDCGEEDLWAFISIYRRLRAAGVTLPKKRVQKMDAYLRDMAEVDADAQVDGEPEPCEYCEDLTRIYSWEHRGYFFVQSSLLLRHGCFPFLYGGTTAWGKLPAKIAERVRLMASLERGEL